jgi:hypothetical protein
VTVFLVDAVKGRWEILPWGLLLARTFSSCRVWAGMFRLVVSSSYFQEATAVPQ